MKHVLIIWTVMTCLCISSFARAPMGDRVAEFASVLGIPINDEPHILSVPVFSGKQIINVGEFRVSHKKMRESPPAALMDVDILDRNGQTIATGRIIERAFFGMARKALLERLVLNSMSIAMLSLKYEVQRNDIGDLCIVEKVYDRDAKTYVVDPRAIHFVRGGTAISLYSKGKDTDIRKIAKALDTVLGGRK